MEFDVRKVDNCFADAQSYEYRIPLRGEQLIERMPDWNIQINQKYRRPMFVGERNGSHAKGVLRANVFRVSFFNECWAEEKAAFEHWLRSQAE